MALQPSVVTAEDIRINVLLYGLQGVGKTTFAASAQDHPDMADVLVLNLEGGLLSVAGRGDIQSVNIGSMSDLEDAYDAVANKREGFDTFNTVVIDSGTEMQNLAIREAVRKSMKRQQAQGRHKDRTEDDVWMEDYGLATRQLARIFRMFRDLNLHVIITALPREIKIPDTETVREVRPSFTETMARDVMGMVDFIWYYYLDNEGNRVILPMSKGVYRAKTRGQHFAAALEGDVVVNPTLPELYDLLIETEGGR